MKLEGKVFKDGKFWLSEVPILDLMTQGTSKSDAIDMMASAIKDLAEERKGLKISIESTEGQTFVLGTNNPDKLISLILKRQREKEGLSIADVVNRLGFSSRNAYARYETSKVKLSMNKFLELYQTITKKDVILKAQ